MLIQVESLSCRRLSKITFSVTPGQVVGLVGSQGSGKTTLLRILAGQLAPTEGSAAIDGVDTRSPEARRKVGLCGEAWGAFPRHTVWENLIAFADLWGLPRAHTAWALQLLDLVPVADVRAERLRAGEVARLRLALAILHDPPVLLLDEPIGDVDRESASVIGYTISELAERGKAILLATFGHARTVELCGQILYLEEGHLILPDRPTASLAPTVEPGGPPATSSDPGTPAVTAVGQRLEVGHSQGADGRGRPDDTPIRHIAARREERLLLFAPAEIHYAFAQEKSVYIMTVDGPCLVGSTLTELEERLEQDGFFRCHRGFLVNVSQVKEIVTYTRDSFCLLLKDGTEVPLSKHRAVELRRSLGW